METKDSLRVHLLSHLLQEASPSSTMVVNRVSPAATILRIERLCGETSIVNHDIFKFVATINKARRSE
jgi:hypothetical protein